MDKQQIDDLLERARIKFNSDIEDRLSEMHEARVKYVKGLENIEKSLCKKHKISAAKLSRIIMEEEDDNVIVSEWDSCVSAMRTKTEERFGVDIEHDEDVIHITKLTNLFVITQLSATANHYIVAFEHDVNELLELVN